MNANKEDSLELIEERVASLEKLVGNFKDLEQTQFLNTVKDISNKLSNYLTENPKLSTQMKSLNDLKKYERFDAINEIDDENLIKAKIELILDEEQNLKKMDKDFESLKSLSKILDNPALNDTPKLLETLRDITAKQAEIKDGTEDFTSDMNQFLTVYFETIKSVNTSMENLSGYLEQYR